MVLVKMSSDLSKEITRRYRIKESVITEKLGLIGEIRRMELFSGLSMVQEEEGKSHDGVIWEFVTVETSEENNILL